MKNKNNGGRRRKPNSNSMMIYLVPDLVEEILLRLPLQSVFKFKTVSKQWKSILESRMYAERRINVRKNNRRKILAAGDRRSKWRFQGDTEIEMFYLHFDDVATRPSLTCDGLICIPVPGWVNVFNPSTGQLLRFPSGPDPVRPRPSFCLGPEFWWINFPGDWAMGFGRDKVNGSYKVVRMFFYTNQFDILDVNIGEWRKLRRPPPFAVESKRKSACVNGSIYWLQVSGQMYALLALDLHTEEFRKIPPPRLGSWSDQLVNLDDRLAFVKTRLKPYPYRRIEICILDAQEKTWTKTYNIFLRSIDLFPQKPQALWFRALTHSNQGHLFFHDNCKRLFKYCPETDEVHLIQKGISVLSPFIENMILFPRRLEANTSEYQVEPETSTSEYQPSVPSFPIFKTFKMPNIFVTTALVSLVIFRYFCVSSRSG